MSMKILVVDPDMTSRTILCSAFADHSVRATGSLEEAIGLADKQAPDHIIMDLDFGSKSGFEFLYELRSFTDWKSIGVTIFSSLRVSPIVLRTHTWQLLEVSYLYKPDSSIAQLVSLVEGTSS